MAHNEHLVRDFGVMNLALVAITLAAVAGSRLRAAARASVIGWLVFSVPRRDLPLPQPLALRHSRQDRERRLTLGRDRRWPSACSSSSAWPSTVAAVANPYLNPRRREFGTTIFAEMSALAVATGAINLGRASLTPMAPTRSSAAAIDAIEAGHNQYPPGIGVPALREAVAAHQRFYGIEYDADSEVLVTAGATEAIAASILALCEDGDEVVTFEPYYDSYAACIAMAGARAPGRAAATTRVVVRSRRSRRCDHAAHEAGPAQLAAQPDGEGVHP